MALLCGLLCWSFAVNAKEESTPKQWLEKMSSAMQELNYEGVFIYLEGGELAAMRVIHVVDEKGAHELLQTLTGEERKELRNTPVGSAAETEQVGLSQLGKIENYYNLSLIGTDRTAGRVTQVVSVTPKDNFRYGYRLWLDDATGLLLKSDLIDKDGTLLEQVMFTSLELLTPDQYKDLFPTNESDTNNNEAKPNEHHAGRQWVIENLPTGFELLDSQPVVQHKGIEHMVYSDGLASVSVFVERNNPEGQAFVGPSRMGAVNAFGIVAGDYQVTVVGEVPEVTVKTICQSVKQKDQTQ